MEKDFHAFLV